MPHVTALDKPASDRVRIRRRTGGSSQRSGLAGRLRSVGRRLRPSLSVGLVGLAVLLAILPFAYYDQQHESERKYGAMLRLWADNESRLAARTLAPLLNAEGATPFRVVQDQLDMMSAPGRRTYLMFRPTAAPDSGFYLVASTPHVSLNGLETEWQQWQDRSSWPSFGALCAGAGPDALTQRGADPVPDTIRSVVPTATSQGCWILITAFDTQSLNGVVDAPKSPWVGMSAIAASLYIAAIALAALVCFRGWQGLNQLGRVAREISERGARPEPFARSNKIPELAGVATDFDRVVMALQAAAESARRSAEDNAHALKTPLATIRHSLQPIKRSISTENDRAKRAVDLIEQSIVRLETLVTSAQPAVQEFVDGADGTTGPVDLSNCLSSILLYYRKMLAARNIIVAEHLQSGVMVEATRGMVELILNNVIDNAISFTPPGGEIMIRLAMVTRYCELTIEDSGPGVDPADIERIFDRYVSLRPTRMTAASGSTLENLHSGLGLWIVRRNVESLGGTVMAANRPTGGFGIRITLPTLV